MIRTEYPSEALGERLVSERAVTMFLNYPQSPKQFTLPAGKPSPIITGYIPSGYWQVEGEDGTAMYIRDEDVQVVSEEAPDQSGLFSGVLSGVSDFVSNTGRDVKKRSGFLADGFQDSITGVGSDIFDFTKEVKIIAIAAAVIVVAVFINKIWE